MVVQKRILVLANSIKKSDRCIAGREIVSDGKEYRLGSWVRPVTDHGEGEVRDVERRYGDGTLVEVMDFAAVPLSAQVNDPCQPENWRIAGTTRWAKLNDKFARPTTGYLIERPTDLWLQGGVKADRVTHDFLTAHPPEQTLYIVRPEKIRLSLWTATWNGENRRKRRCVFSYNGTEYDLSLTDPVFTSRYQTQIPGPGSPPVEISLPCCDRFALCVSLAGNLEGWHYKVVATVFEEAQ